MQVKPWKDGPESEEPVKITDLGQLKEVGPYLDLKEKVLEKVLKELAKNPNLKPINLTDWEK